MGLAVDLTFLQTFGNVSSGLPTFSADEEQRCNGSKICFIIIVMWGFFNCLFFNYYYLIFNSCFYTMLAGVICWRR